MQDLGDLPGGLDFSHALNINDSGHVVGYSAAASMGFHAFIWTGDDGIQDLNTLMDGSGLGWTFEFAHAINNGGQIVGKGVNPAGAQHAFLLTPIAEPSMLALGGCGFVIVGLVGIRGGRRKIGVRR
jgi:probable HAF family extracellular repeat protein